jgi:hypothetical protein
MLLPLCYSYCIAITSSICYSSTQMWMGLRESRVCLYCPRTFRRQEAPCVCSYLKISANRVPPERGAVAELCAVHAYRRQTTDRTCEPMEFSVTSFPPFIFHGVRLAQSLYWVPTSWTAVVRIPADNDTYLSSIACRQEFRHKRLLIKWQPHRSQ